MNNNFNNFNNMDDLFNQLMGGMRGYSSENRRYLINGREVTPEEFAHYRTTGQLPGNAETDVQMPQQASGMKQDGVLAKLGRNLTAEAREGKLDPVIGRNKEIQETSEILSRRTKNNPVLVGDAGVGKTAVVEGLAQAIVNGDVPAAIKNKEIISIDISGLEAGTQYRGSFEENVQNLVNEVKEAGNIILFFDEIHQILGAGSTGGDSGSKGLADILKPALSRGELTVIGATTQDEYRNTILKNAALARRFNEVKVNAPSAVDYSVQYIPQRSLPDKAIDLVDVTAAHLAAQHPVTDVHAVEREIETEKDKQEKAVEAEDFEAALNYKTRIAELEKKIENHTEDMKVTASVNDVAESVERMTGIPVSQMGASDIERLKDMAHRLQDKVIGQDKAVEAVARAIRRNRAGFDEGNRPIGSFLFVGSTGVGKTELAKQLALDMFGTQDAIIRLDMSEYSDRTAVSKLIGTTAGYVGYDDNSNTLTERVRRNPYSIILLDEIEKADPQVITLLLQVLDDGRLTDGQGNTVNFKNTVIIATSNAGFGYEANLTEDADKSELMDRLKPFFRPEFLNRFNAVIEFSHLTKEDLSKILDLMLAEVNQTLAKKDIDLVVSQAAKDYITEEGYDEVMGVRPLRRVVEQEIRDKVTDFHLDHLDAKHLEADMEDGVLVIREKA
ncbi:TPA: AAA family ATPase [Streptococcus pneumoniae]